MKNIRHFLDLDRLDSSMLRGLIKHAKKLKTENNSGQLNDSLAGKNLVCIFEKQSTRTRISFQLGMQQLGGTVAIMNENDFHMGKAESIADTARVLSRFSDAIMLRTDRPEKLHELANNATIPVINGLTDFSHPCQIMADIMTFEEHRGPIFGKTVAWSGDGNNVLNSWIHAAVQFGFHFKIGTPRPFRPPQELMEWALMAGGQVEICDSARQAVAEVDLVITDTWVSMGSQDHKAKMEHLLPFQVNKELMSYAHPNAIFMHCLPAHRGREVTDDVIDGENSVVWDEAENRIHIQKSILAWCMS